MSHFLTDAQINKIIGNIDTSKPVIATAKETKALLRNALKLKFEELDGDFVLFLASIWDIAGTTFHEAIAEGEYDLSKEEDRDEMAFYMEAAACAKKRDAGELPYN